MARSLRSDIAFFDANIEDIRARANAVGKDAVLIYDAQIIGFYDSVVEAGQDGYRKFMGELFLARSVSPERQTAVLASVLRG